MALPQLHRSSVELLWAGKAFIFSCFLIVSQKCLLGKKESGGAGPSVSSNSEVL